MPQFLCSQAHILAGWHLETQMTISCGSFPIVFDCRLKRLPQILFQLPGILVIQPRSGPNRKHSFHRYSSKYLDCRLRIRCSGNVFTKPLPSNRRLFWLHYSGFQASCHNMLWLFVTKKKKIYRTFRPGSEIGKFEICQ
jgi:hypothetical protein